MRLTRLWLVVVVILSLTATTAPGVVRAEVPGDTPRFDALGISPTKRTLDVRAGETLDQQVTLINDGETTITYRLRTTDYQVHDGDYNPMFPAAASNAGRSTAGWFRVPTNDVHLAPHDQITVKFPVVVPAGAVVGGHYGVVFAETVPPPPPPGSASIARVKRVGAVFYLTVAGDLHRSGQLSLGAIPAWFEHPPVLVHFTVKNTGNTHFDVAGRLGLSPLLGASLPSVDLRGTVLPTTSRNFEVQLPTSHAIGLYQLSGSVDYLGDQHPVGPQWVLVMPLITLVVVAGTVLLMFAGLVWLIIRRLRVRGSRRPL